MFKLISLWCMFHSMVGQAIQLGVLMCEENCLYLAGCKGFEFVKKDLQCRLLTKKPGAILQGTVLLNQSHVKGNLSVCSLKRCSKGGRCIKKKTEQYTCVPSSENLNGRVRQQMDVLPRLIIANKRSSGTRFYQMNFQTNQIEEYRHFKLGSVESMCYMKKSKKLLISARKPDIIVSHEVDTNYSMILRKDVYRSMVVDEGRQLLFTLPLKTRQEIIKISLAGERDTSFASRDHDMFLEITLDKINKLLFVRCKLDIKTIGYDGEQVQRLHLDGHEYKFGFAIALNKGELYYSIGRDVFKKNMRHFEYEKIATLSFKPYCFQFFNESIYMKMFGGSSSSNVYKFDLVRRDGHFNPISVYPTPVHGVVHCVIL